MVPEEIEQRFWGFMRQVYAESQDCNMPLEEAFLKRYEIFVSMRKSFKGEDLAELERVLKNARDYYKEQFGKELL